MTPDRPETPNDLPVLAERIARLIADYHATIADRPVSATTQPRQVYDALPDAPPDSPEPWEAILADVESIVLPNLTHWQSPNFFGFFPANASVPAIAAELLCAGLGVQGMLWSTSPAATEVEMRVLDWLAGMIGLPQEFTFASEGGGGGGGGGGVIQGTASEAVLTMMIAARHRARLAGARDTDLVAYTSSQAHSSVAKAARMMGLADGALRLIETDDTLAMRPEALRAALERDAVVGLRPFFAAATLGTTSTGAFDPLAAIAPVCAERGVFLHVDAAWAGSALVCPEHRAMIDGVTGADSFNFNPHKWLLTNFDCSCLWVRDRKGLIDSMSITPEYLRNPASESGQVVDYRDWHIPLGRRFRALKLWFVIRRYGVEGLRAHIRRHVALAEEFEQWARGNQRLEVVMPRSLALVCLAHRAGDEATKRLHERLNASGRAYLSHTIVPINGAPRFVIRVAIGGAATQREHVRALWNLIDEHA